MNNKKLLLCALAAVACIGQASTFSQQKFEEMAVKFKEMVVKKEKLWDKYAYFKKATEVKDLTLTNEQKADWNKYVTQAEEALTELKNFNQENNNLFVENLNKDREIKKLTSQMLQISQKYQKEVKKKPEYKAIKEELEQITQEVFKIEQKAKSIREKIKGTQEKINALRSPQRELRGKQRKLIEQDPEYQEEAKEIEKKHVGLTGMRGKIDAMNALKTKMKEKYAQNEEYKTLEQQIKNIESEIEPLKAKIKPETDEIEALLKESVKAFQKKSELRRKQSEMVEQPAKKDPTYAQIDAQLKEYEDKRSKNMERLMEKLWPAFGIEEKYDRAESSIREIFEKTMYPKP